MSHSLTMGFELEDFIDSPSLDKLELCRKDDLLAVAAHFNIPVQKYGVKKDIKRKVVETLRELNVLSVPVSLVVEPSAEGVLSPEDGQVEPVIVTTPPADIAQGRGAPATLPRFEPFSPESHGSGVDAKLKVRLARLQLEAQEKESMRKAEYDHRLQVRKLEIEAEKEVKLRQLEVEAQRISFGRAAPHSETSTHASLTEPVFNVGKNVALVPVFRESEVDSYFNAFERIATALDWPKDMWPILLHCKLVGKAQEVVSSLSLEEGLNYDVLKETILRAYELVPEAYRQKFRIHKKPSGQTFVEFAREKGVLFDKWCTSSGVKSNFESLRQLMLLEDFKNALPEKLVVFLNEQKVTTLSKAAVLADEFVLTHKNVFVSPSRPERIPVSGPVRPTPGYTPLEKVKGPLSPPRETRECFYCHKKGHVLVDCLSLKRKQLQPPVSQPKSMGLIKSKSPGIETSQIASEPDPCFKPFILEGFVSVTGDPKDQRPVTMLRDTGGSQSIIREGILPLSHESSCHSSAVIQGVGMRFIPAPLHCVHIRSSLINGFFKVAVRPALPINGVDVIVGNDLAGGKVMPVPEVLDNPDLSLESVSTTQPLEIFPACVVTQAQAKKYDIDLSDSFLSSEPVLEVVTRSNGQPEAQMDDIKSSLPNPGFGNLPATRDEFIKAQQADVTLEKCHSTVVNLEAAKQKNIAYVLDNGLLMRRWASDVTENKDWGGIYQVVVPTVFRSQVLSLAHDHPWSGHLGITKTYNRVLKHFFWPGLKSDVVQYCRTCHVCQVVGKPNQVIPPAPLCPIPVTGEPFDRVIVDCVGPLPKTKAGNQFLLAIMCASTRFPEAVPLRKITAPVITKALVKFFSLFGLPKVVQTDQGTNFKSKLFAQALKSLDVKHITSSPYHPESQGALERFHQTMKSMLRKHCIDSQKDWDDGVPLVLFAAREAVQESLGFSPAELVFGREVRGPLKVLKEQLIIPELKVKSIPEYVAKLKERLQLACSLASKALTSSQGKMKKHHDKRAVACLFQPGDKVLILLPVPGSALSTRFSGPYVVESKLSDTNYIIKTPDRRRQTRVCHVNMMKRYHPREDEKGLPTTQTVSPIASISEVTNPAALDGLVMRNATPQGARLGNTEVLRDLPHYLSHLQGDQSSDIIKLIHDFPSLFGDIPSQTSVITNDIVLTNPMPIKQRAYRVSPAKREVMKKEVEYLLLNGFAVPSCSSWSSPCLLDVKSDGSPRFCTDFRRVNSVTVPDAHPLPRIVMLVSSIC